MDQASTYLGIIVSNEPDSFRGPLAQLYPLHAWTEDTGWQPIEDPSYQFPNRGLVTWFHPSTDAASGTVWQFRIEPQPSFDPGNQGHDRFKITTASPVREVVRLGADNCEQARKMLTEEGVEMLFLPSTDLFLDLDGKTWVGPLSLRRDSNGLFFLPDEFRTAPVPCVQPVEGKCLVQLEVPPLNAKRRRTFIVPGFSPRRTGSVDWSPDDDLLRRVLQGLRKIDKTYTDSLGLTQKAIERITAELYPDEFSGANAMLVKQRVERARSITTAFGSRKRLLEKFGAELLALPEVTEVLQQAQAEAAEQVRQQLRDEIASQRRAAQAELEAELERTRAKAERDTHELRRREALQVSEVEAHLQQIKAQIDALTQRKEAIAREIDEHQAKLNAQEAEFVNALNARLKEMVEQPVSALANLAVSRVVFDRHLDAKDSPPVGVRSLPELGLGPNSAKRLSGEAKELRRVLREAYGACGVSSRIGWTLHAAFLAGAVPVLYGGDALQALEAYAHATLGTRLLWVPVSPAILEPADLFGRTDSPSGRFTPHANGLIDLLVNAQADRERAYLVVLHGINHSLIDAYLEPVLQSRSGAALGRPRDILPLVRPSSVGSSSDNAAAARLVWPSNVLLAGTWADGISVSPSRALWSNAVFISTELYGEDSGRLTSDPKQSTAGSYCLDPNTWNTQQQLPTDDVVEEIDRLLQGFQTESLQIRRSERTFMYRYFERLKDWVSGPEAAAQEILATSVVPIVLSLARQRPRQEVEQLLGTVDERVTKALAIADEALRS